MLTVFLDLDGTLIDPVEGTTSCIQHALQEVGEEVPPVEDLTWCIGPPLRDSFEILLGRHGDVDAALAIYRDRYGEEGLYEADVYDGIDQMLLDLRQTGAGLWIATSKPQIYADKIVEHFGIAHYVDGVFGADLNGDRSDKAELLGHALETTETDPARALMLGDRKYDIIGARNSGMMSIGALWGYAEPEELHYADADALAGAPEEVAEIA